MVWIIAGFLGVFAVFWGLRWVARTDASIVARRLSQLIRFGLILLGSIIVGFRSRLLLVFLRFLPFLFNVRGRARARAGLRGQDAMMSLAQARAILQVSATASKDEIRQSWRHLMRAAHPDQGGSQEDAIRLNQARDILLKKK